MCRILGVHSPKDISGHVFMEAGRQFLFMLTRIIVEQKDRNGKMIERDTTTNARIHPVPAPRWNYKPVPLFSTPLKKNCSVQGQDVNKSDFRKGKKYITDNGLQEEQEL